MLRGDAIRVKPRTVRIEPARSGARVRAKFSHHAPERPGVIHVDKMRAFMRGDIIENLRRRQNEPPAKGYVAFRGT